MNRTRNTFAITLPTLLLTFFVKPQSASAEEVSLGIYPPVTRLVGLPGETVQATIHIRNNQNTSLVLTPLLQPFTASSAEDGTVMYQESITGFYRTVKIQDEGNTVTEIPLGPMEEKSIEVIIPIQPQAKSEDYYFSFILLKAPNVSENTPIDKTVTASTSLSGGVASHILLSISPKKDQKLTLVEFSTASFSQSSPVGFVTRVANESDNYARVHGTILIKNVLGKVVEEVIIPETVVLGHSTRALESQAREQNNNTIQNNQNIYKKDQSISPQVIQQKEILLPGIYKAEVILSGRTDSNPITSSLFLAIAPLHLIAGIFVALLLLYVLKRRIVAKLNK